MSFFLEDNRLMLRILWSGFKTKNFIMASAAVFMVPLVIFFVTGRFGLHLIDFFITQYLAFGLVSGLSAIDIMARSFRNAWLYSNGTKLKFFNVVENQFLIRIFIWCLGALLVFFFSYPLYKKELNISPIIFLIPLWLFSPLLLSFYVMLIVYGRYLNNGWIRFLPACTGLVFIAISLVVFHAGNEVERDIVHCDKEYYAFFPEGSVHAASEEELIKKGIDSSLITELTSKCISRHYSTVMRLFNAEDVGIAKIIWLILTSFMCCLIVRQIAKRYWLNSDLIRVPSFVHP